jgi:hypothetical protein
MSSNKTCKGGVKISLIVTYMYECGTLREGAYFFDGLGDEFE